MSASEEVEPLMVKSGFVIVDKDPDSWEQIQIFFVNLKDGSQAEILESFAGLIKGAVSCAKFH